jgi:acyl-CoA synthetase (AMP-forming)/AMP-acid ligase II
MLHAASLIHASGTFVLPYWLRGGCATVLPGFDPETYLDDVARYRATEINLVPTMLGMLVTSGAAERADVSHLRTALYGASPMPRPVQYYGQTEAPLASPCWTPTTTVTPACSGPAAIPRSTRKWR